MYTRVKPPSHVANIKAAQSKGHMQDCMGRGRRKERMSYMRNGSRTELERGTREGLGEGEGMS